MTITPLDGWPLADAWIARSTWHWQLLFRQQITPAVLQKMRARVGPQRRADPLGGKHLEQQRAGHSAVDDVHRAHAFAHRLQCRGHPRAHATVDDTVAQERLALTCREDVHELA